jgi:hypothetical protein
MSHKEMNIVVVFEVVIISLGKGGELTRSWQTKKVWENQRLRDYTRTLLLVYI